MGIAHCQYPVLTWLFSIDFIIPEAHGIQFDVMLVCVVFIRRVQDPAGVRVRHDPGQRQSFLHRGADNHPGHGLEQYYHDSHDSKKQ